MDVSGFLDGYGSYNSNDPSEGNNGKVNDLYNFNDKTNQWALNAAKLTLNHDPAPVGAHVDLVYGRVNKLVNASNQLEFVEQAFVSVKPPKAKGFELDLGKWVTSAGAEVIESKDNWNYSRSILFACSHRIQGQLELLALDPFRVGYSLLSLRRPHIDACLEDRNHRGSGRQRMEQHR